MDCFSFASHLLVCMILYVCAFTLQIKGDFAHLVDNVGATFNGTFKLLYTPCILKYCQKMAGEVNRKLSHFGNGKFHGGGCVESLYRRQLLCSYDLLLYFWHASLYIYLLFLVADDLKV